MRTLRRHRRYSDRQGRRECRASQEQRAADRLVAPALVAALAGVALGARAAAAAESYALDPEHTTIAFLVSHIGYAKVLGRFMTAQGSFRFDEATGELADIDVSVAATSVSTDHEARDEHLRGHDFLNAERYAAITFVATHSKQTGDGTFEVAGELTLLGATRPFTLQATLNKSGEYPLGDRAHVLGVSARGTLQRSTFGMSYAVDNGWVGDDVEVIIEFEARRQ
jgi:polyisoprenoid-binding protein YceI